MLGVCTVSQVLCVYIQCIQYVYIYIYMYMYMHVVACMIVVCVPYVMFVIDVHFFP